jgi:hypothetical protein
MILDLFLFEHPQVQHASTPIGYLKLPLVTFENLCRNCKHVVSNLGLKIGVAERIVLQLGVVILLWLQRTIEGPPLMNRAGSIRTNF